MAQAKKKLFSGEADKQSEKSEIMKNKQIISTLIEKLKQRLGNKEDAQKAALILEQWIHESNERKLQKEDNKKSA